MTLRYRLARFRHWCWLHWERIMAGDSSLVCAHCEETFGTHLHWSRTAYHTDEPSGSRKDPNRPRLLCRTCRERDVEHWDDMWAEYYSGLL